MKVFITDEFLRDVYSFLQETGSVLDSLFVYPTMRNSLPGPKNPVFEKYKKERGMQNFDKLVYYLKKKGYIKVKSLDNKRGIILTKDGIDRAIKASFKLDRKKRADGKWAMLIFDIPEKSRGSRSLLRGALKSLGYKLFQQSVWISPYDVSEKTEIFVQSHDLEKYVKIFLIEEI
jgi:hypothetical protein